MILTEEDYTVAALSGKLMSKYNNKLAQLHKICNPPETEVVSNVEESVNVYRKMYKDRDPESLEEFLFIIRTALEKKNAELCERETYSNWVKRMSLPRFEDLDE